MFTRIAISILIGLIFVFPKIRELISVYKIPIRHINKLPESGQVQIVGRADTKNTKSPLKHANCCLWQLTVDEDRGGKGGGYVRIFERMSTEPFDLKDSTGRIQVFPENADLILHDDVDKKSSSMTPLPSQIEESLQGLGVKTINDFGFQKRLWVTESFIKPGDNVIIVGEVINENGVKAIKSSGKFPFVISDYRDSQMIINLLGYIILKTFFIALPIFMFLMFLSNK